MDGVLYAGDVESKFPKHTSHKAFGSYESYKLKRAKYDQLISDAEIQISNIMQQGGNYSDLDSLVKLRETYREELSRLRSPVVFHGYYGYSSIYYFLACYIFLCLGIFVLSPNTEKIRRSQVILFAVLIHLGWASTAFVRNFVFFDEGRKVFSYINYDISPASYILQDLRTLIMSILISILWQKWIVYYEEISQSVTSWREVPQSLMKISEHAQEVSDMFNRWQLNSVVLVAAFLPWTMFYWIYVIQYGDNRYTIAAFVMHLYWATSWIIISAPLIHMFNKWSILKAKAMAFTSSRQDNSPETDRAISLIKEINPLTSLQIVSAGIISTFSFVSPLINLFIGR